MTERDSLTFLSLMDTIDDSYIQDALRPWNNSGHSALCQRARAGRPHHVRFRRLCFFSLLMIFLLFAGILYQYPEEIKAGWEKISTKIEEILGIKKDIFPYTDVIHTSVTHNGLTVTLEEVILSQDELLVAYTLSADASPQMENLINDLNEIVMNANAWVNEFPIIEREEHAYAGNPTTEVRRVTCFRFEDSYLENGLGSFRLEFHPEIWNSHDAFGAFVFEFTASNTELQKEEIFRTLSEQIMITDTCILELNEFQMDPITSSISGSCENLIQEGNDYWVEYFLKGTDNLGNPLRYRMNQYIKPDIRFVLDKRESVIDADAEWISLQLYGRTHQYTEADIVDSTDDNNKSTMPSGSETSSEAALPGAGTALPETEFKMGKEIFINLKDNP